MEHLAQTLTALGFLAYVLLFAVAVAESAAFVGLAAPGETFAIAAGVLASRGHLSLTWLIVVAIVGAAVGDTVGYGLGRRFGYCARDGWRGRILPCERTERVSEFLERRGGSAVFFGRFVGFLRALVPFAAGAARMAYPSFLFYNVAGAVVWGAGTVLAGYFLGSAAERLLSSISIAALGAVVVVGIAVWLVVRRRRRGRAGRVPASDRG